MSTPETKTCQVCGQAFPLAALAAFGNDFVCAECKPVYTQRLREGLDPVPVAAAGAFADEAVPELRQGALGLDRLFGISWGVFTRQFARLFGMLLLVTLPAAAATDVVRIYVVTHPQAAKALVAGNGLIVLVQVVLSCALAGACFAIIARDTAGRQVALGAALAHGLQRWGSMLWAAICLWAILAVVAMVLILPGVLILARSVVGGPGSRFNPVWLALLIPLGLLGVTALLGIMSYFLLITQCAALTTAGGAKALGYSRALTRGRWLTVVGYHILIGMLCGTPASLLGLAGGLANRFVPLLPTQLFATLFGTPFQAFQFCFLGVFFLNLHRSRLAHPEFQAKHPGCGEDLPGLLAP